MLLKFYREQNVPTIFAIIITAVLFWAVPLTNYQSQSQIDYQGLEMPFYSLLVSIIGGSGFACVFFSFFLTGVISVLLVVFNTKVFFLRERTFLPSVIFMMLSALVFDNQQLNPALPASLFLLLATIRVVESYRKNGLASNYFDAGLMIAAGTLFYQGLIWFSIIPFIGIVLLRTTNIREILFIFSGLITPFILVGGAYYIAGYDLLFFAEIAENIFSNVAESYKPAWFELAAISFTSFITLMSCIFLFTLMDGKKIKSRKTFYILLWILTISVAAFLIIPSVSVEMLWIAAIPVSYLLTHFLMFARSRLIRNIVFTGLFVLIVIKQIMYLL